MGVEPFSVPMVPAHVAGSMAKVLPEIGVVQGCAFAWNERKERMVTRIKSLGSIR